MSMHLSVHLVSSRTLSTIGARRRRGGSRVSVSGQARDGGTRGVNKNKMKNTNIPKDVKAFNLESGVIRNSTINSKSRIRIAGDKTEIDNTQLDGHVNILRDSVVKDCKISL